MITASVSGSIEVAEELISYFVDIGNKECFAGLLYICFDLLRPDLVEELSWQHGLKDFYMPYQIQIQRCTAERVCTYTHLYPILTPFLSAGSIREGDEGALEKGQSKRAGISRCSNHQPRFRRAFADNTQWVSMYVSGGIVSSSVILRFVGQPSAMTNGTGMGMKPVSFNALYLS